MRLNEIKWNYRDYKRLQIEIRENSKINRMYSEITSDCYKSQGLQEITKITKNIQKITKLLSIRLIPLDDVTIQCNKPAIYLHSMWEPISYFTFLDFYWSFKYGDEIVNFVVTANQKTCPSWLKIEQFQSKKKKTKQKIAVLRKRCLWPRIWILNGSNRALYTSVAGCRVLFSLSLPRRI